MVVRGGVVTIAVAHGTNPGLVEVFQFDGDAWHRVTTLPGNTTSTHITTACDGVFTVGHGGPARLTRLEPDGGASLELPTSANQVGSLVRAADGSMFVMVQASSLGRVLRVHT